MKGLCHSLGGASVATAIALGSALAVDAGERLTVVELFTSQGCNSCPPADRYLGQLAERDDILSLSFNVDYWDYLGWRDTLASPVHTERQRRYSTAMRSRRVYTPQMVIGGTLEKVGSDRASVSRAIENVRGDARIWLAIEIERVDDMIVARLPGGRMAREATIWLVRYDSRREVEIRRGENGGRTIAYHNVVRDFDNIGLWRGEAMEVAFKLSDLVEGGRDRCAILVQIGGQGPIIGAARMAIDDDS